MSEAPGQVEAVETFVDEDALRRRKRNKRLRLLALALFVIGSIVVAQVSGLSEHVTIQSVRATMEAGGAFGFFAFIATYAIGNFMHVPGLVFVGAASIAYGHALAIPAAYLGSMVSVTLNFLVARLIGGTPIEDGRPRRRTWIASLADRPSGKTWPVRAVLWISTRLNRWGAAILARLDTQPIRTVVLLRLLFWLSPWLNYALAMSKVSTRNYIIGSAIGLIGPIVLAVLFFDWLATYLM